MQAIRLDVLQGTYRVEVGNEVVQVEQQRSQMMMGLTCKAKEIRFVPKTTGIH